MFKRKCANCGYNMGLIEFVITDVGRSAAMSQGVFDALSYTHGITCPKCGETDRWIRK